MTTARLSDNEIAVQLGHAYRRLRYRGELDANGMAAWRTCVEMLATFMEMTRPGFSRADYQRFRATVVRVACVGVAGMDPDPLCAEQVVHDLVGAEEE